MKLPRTQFGSIWSNRISIGLRLAASIALLAGVLTYFSFWRLPRHEGKSIRGWIAEYRDERSGKLPPEQSASEQALLAMGGEAMPYLIKRIDMPLSGWRYDYAVIHQNAPKFFKKWLPRPSCPNSDQNIATSIAAKIVAVELESADDIDTALKWFHSLEKDLGSQSKRWRCWMVYRYLLRPAAERLPPSKGRALWKRLMQSPCRAVMLDAAIHATSH